MRGWPGRTQVFVFFVIFLFSLLAVASVGAKTIYVDWTNSADPSQDGTAAHPYDSIQEAVYGAYVADEIFIANGTYNESVEVNQTVTITGNGSVTVDPGSSYGFEVTEDYAEIIEISIVNASHGVHIAGPDWVDLTRLDIADSNIGIWILTSNNITMYDCTSEYNDQDGIYLGTSKDITIREGSYSYNDQHGISLEESTGNTIRDLEALDNDGNGIHMFSNSDDNSVRDCTIKGNARNVNIRSSDDQIIRRCDISEGDGSSLFLYTSRDVDIWDSQTYPGNVTVEVLSELNVYNTSIWRPNVGSDSELIVSNWVIVRVITAPPTSFGISEADVKMMDHWDSSNDTVYSTDHYGGNDDLTDLDGWSERVLVLTREYDGSDLTVHNHTFDVHYFGWTNSTAESNITMGSVNLGTGSPQIIVNASTEVVFQYPLVVYYGDVTVNSVTNWTSLSVIVFGNLTIDPTGYLTLTNTQLWIASNGTANHIEVKGGGTLAILDGDGNAGTMNDASVISPLGNGTFTGLPVDIEPNLRFWARSNSELIARNSILAGLGVAGDAIGDKGLLVETDDATFVDMNFSYCRIGINLNLIDSVQIVRCTFYSCDIGVLSTSSTNIGFEDSTFKSGGTGIDGFRTTNLTITGSVFEDMDTGAILTNSSVSIDMTEFDGTGTGLNATGSLRSLDVMRSTFANGGAFAWVKGEHPAPYETSFINLSLINSSTGLHADGSVRVTAAELEIDSCGVGIELWNLNKRPVLENITIDGTLAETGISMVDIPRGNITNLTLISLVDGLDLDNCTNMIIRNVDSLGCYRVVNTVDGSSISITDADLELGGVLGSMGIVTDSTSDVTLVGIDMTDGETGISMTGGSGAVLTGINTSGTTNGLLVSGTAGLELNASGFDDGDVGMSVSGTGCTLSEVTVNDMEDAVSVGGSGSTLEMCTITYFGTGIVASGTGHTLIYNNLTSGSVGISLDGLSNSDLTENTIEECERGIEFIRSYGNDLDDNNIDKHDDNYAFFFGDNGLYNSIGRSNRVNGAKTSFYYDHQWSISLSSLIIDEPLISNVGQVAFVNCSSDIVFQYSNITGGDAGLYALNTVDLHIIDTDFSDNVIGVSIDNCSDIEINYTNIWYSDKGIAIDGSNRIVVGANGTIRKCGRGIEIFDSVSVRIADAIRVEDSTVGIYAYNATKLRFEGTSTQRTWVKNAVTGMRIVASSGTIFEHGVVKDSTTGISLGQCTDTELGSIELVGCDVGVVSIGGSGLSTAVNDAPVFESCGVGLELDDPDMTIIEMATFSGCDYGIDLDGGEDVLISRCEFDSNGMALIASQANGLMLHDSTIEGTGDGFLIKDSSFVSVNGSSRTGGSNLLRFEGVNSSIVADTRIENVDSGIELDGTTEIKLKDITAVYTSTSPIGAPISGDIAFHVIDSVNVTIAEVTIDRYDGGIHISGGGPVLVRDSTVSNAGYRGISTDDTGATIEDVMLNGCDIGIYSYMSTLTILDAYLGGGNTGISGDETEMTGSSITVSDHSSSGLWFEGSLATLSDLTVSESGLGLGAADGSYLQVSNADLNNNSEGIQLSFSDINITATILKDNRVGLGFLNSTAGVMNITLLSLETDMMITNSTASLIQVSLLSDGITGIETEDSSVYGRNIAASGLIACMVSDGGSLILRNVNLSADGTAVDATKTALDLDRCTLSGAEDGLLVSGGTLKMLNTDLVDSGAGVDIRGGEVKTFRYNSITGCDVAIDVTSAVMPHIVGLEFADNDLDLSMFDAGVVVVTDTSFDTWDLEDTSVEVRNYLRVRIISQSTGYGMGTGEVRIWDDGGGGDIYATPYFNGTNSTTGKSGYTDEVLARSATYTASGVTFFTTGVELKMPGWFMKDYGVNMNVSHTETYTYGMATFQTIKYVDGRDQTGLIGTKLKKQLEVVVQDDKSGEMEGIAVAWEIISPNSTDAKISPKEGLSDVNGSVRCNVTLPSTASNLTIIAYLKLDDIKNVTFDLVAEDIEFDLVISTSGIIYIGDDVVFVVDTDLNGAQYFLDFGDGSNTGWTTDTYFTHSYKAGMFMPSLQVMTNTGLISNPVTENVRVQEPEVVIQQEEGDKTDATQFIIPLFVLIIIIVILAIKVMVPDLGKGLMDRKPRIKRAKKDVDFDDSEEFELMPEEPEKEKPAAAAPKKGGETLEDLIIGLEKHKKGDEKEGKKSSFFSKEQPKKPEPAKEPPASKSKNGGKK